jgi:hypothetical protein
MSRWFHLNCSYVSASPPKLSAMWSFHHIPCLSSKDLHILARVNHDYFVLEQLNEAMRQMQGSLAYQDVEILLPP